MSEPVMQFRVGEPLSEAALAAISIHLKNGCVFAPVFQALEMEERSGETVVTRARLVALSLVRPATIPVLPKVARGRVKSA